MKHTMMAVLLATALAAPAAMAQTGGGAGAGVGANAGAGGAGVGANAGAAGNRGGANNGGMPSQRVGNENSNGSGAIMTVSPSAVREIQQALNRLGYSAGAVNGVWNQATADAMVHFQQAHGLEPTGNLNFSSIAGLGLWENIIGDPNGNGKKALAASNGAPPPRGGKQGAKVGGEPLPSQRITNEAPGGGGAGHGGTTGSANRR